MRSLIPFRIAARLLLVLFGLAFLFQVAVLAGLIPTEMVWGGRLRNAEERTVGALVSGSVLLFAMALVRVRMGKTSKRLQGLGRWGMWVMAVLFALNTVGNVFALDAREALIFTPVTLVLALLCWRLAVEKQPIAR